MVTTRDRNNDEGGAVSNEHELLVIGAGPKAIALHLKSSVLRSLGIPSPQVTIIERAEVAAHWSGNNGYTDGHRILCTPPELDLGFPYNSIFGKDVDRALRAFSWHDFKVERGEYREYINAQSRERQPDHRTWTEYLRWASTKAQAYCIRGRVRRLDNRDTYWNVEYIDAFGRTRERTATGVVVTGPGEPKKLPAQDSCSAISDGKSFWYQQTQDALRHLSTARIAVIGNGETAGTILCALLDLFKNQPGVTLYSYMRSWPEQRNTGEWTKYLTDPTGWEDIDDELRNAFLANTDKGKFSPTTYAQLDAAFRSGKLVLAPGYMTSARAHGDRAELRGTQGKTGISTIYEHAVIAKGFDPLATIPLVRPRLPQWGKPKYRERRIAGAIEHDLSVADMFPKLHLPVFAALRQGPGLPRLYCLGVMSDRILAPYVGLASPTAADMEGVDNSLVRL